ncbi:MAG: YecR family lipoprotein [Pseudomonadota bacterium]
MVQRRRLQSQRIRFTIDTRVVTQASLTKGLIMQKFSIIALALFLSACAGTPITKVPVAISGSKADANIRLSYEEGFHEDVTVNWAEGEANALKRCQAWGYSRVESFAGGSRSCIERGRGIFNGVPVGQCANWQHVKDFQCVD